MIKIDLNKELDYEVYADFWDFSIAGTNFGEKISKDHPSINRENYKIYIDKFYADQKECLIKTKEEIDQILKENQSTFFLELNKLFNIDFSQTNYQGYLSIFNCNPRWVNKKTFQVYWQKDHIHAIEVAFHEVLHFAFFDYLDENFSEMIRGLDKNQGSLWEMSEVINVLILNLPQFRSILKIEETLFYPRLQEKLDLAQKIWQQSGDIDKFISQYLEKMPDRAV